MFARRSLNGARFALLASLALALAFGAGRGRAAAMNVWLSSVYVSGVPNVPEDDWVPNCGPAAVTDVVQSYDPSITYERVLHATLNRLVGGTYISSVTRFGRSLGFSVIEERFTTLHDPDLLRLYGYLAGGTPVLVEQGATIDDVTMHMRVVVGIDAATREVVLTDPLFGSGYRVSFADFTRLQADGPNLYIVFVPRDPAKRHHVSTTAPDYGRPLPLQRRRLYAEEAYGMALHGENRAAALFLLRHTAEFEGRERAIMFEHTAYFARLGGYTSLALHCLQEAQKQFGPFSWIAIERARNLFAQGRSAEAARAIAPYAATLGADDLLFYGDVLRENGDRSGALAAYRRVEGLEAGRLNSDVRWRMALVGG